MQQAIYQWNWPPFRWSHHRSPLRHTKKRSIQTCLSPSSNHSISKFAAFGLSVNGGKDCRKTKELRLIHALGTLNPHGINERFTSVNLLLSRNLFVFLTNFFLTHSYSFMSFVFHIPISLRYFGLHRYINTSLFIIHAFNPTKDHSPKRQGFFNILSPITTV